MEDMTEKEDALKRLFKDEGLLSPSRDFTDRVMQLVESEKTIKYAYKPLLGRSAWTLIITGMIMLVMMGWWTIVSNKAEESVYSETAKSFVDFLNSIDFSIHFNSSGLLIATIAVACIGMLLSFDILLSHKYHEV